MPYDNAVYADSVVEVGDETISVPVGNNKVYFEKAWTSTTS